MSDVDFKSVMPLITERLAHGGVFLSVPGQTPNTLTIGWATLGWLWNKPYFVALIRPSRHSYGLLMEARRFSVSVPVGGQMKKELAFAGSASGRDLNKFEGHGISLAPGRMPDLPIVSECELHLECAVRMTQAMSGEDLDPAVRALGYPEGDMHTMFYGEVLACYRS